VRPCQRVLACERQAFFGHTGTHGQVGSAQFYQVNGARGGLQHLCQCAAQGFGAVKHSEPFKLRRPLQGNVPVAVGPGRTRGAAAYQHGKFQMLLGKQSVH
jgi:hypothetical protein